LLDGHGSHDTREFHSFCDEKKIIPFCPLQHTIHMLQTLEIVVFKPPKHYYAEALDYAIYTGCSDFHKIKFLVAITSIWAQAFKKSTNISSCHKSELIPYNSCLVFSLQNEYNFTESHPSYKPPMTLLPVFPQVVFASTYNSISTATCRIP
ncbi:hypothetical protein L873DRAFT_1724137, partial [Choiromyces venosus 120613-1]